MLLVMGPHPIPQNVTSFQFHLVGDMTLKQFLYLAAGAGLAYLLFVFFSPAYPIIVWPLILISASMGAAFAFLPVGSRPLDRWLLAFLKAVYSPTKRAWKKNNKNFKEDPLFSSRLITYLSSLQPVTTTDYRLPTTAATPQAEAGRPKSEVTPPIADLPTTAELGKTVDLARQAQNLQLKILQNERTLNQIKAEAQKPTNIPIDYSQQVNKIIADLQTLVSQASNIRYQLDAVTKPETVQQTTAIPAAALKEKIKVIIPAKPRQTQLALTTFPNVINGIARDKTGSYLEGVVAVIYDKEGMPVRALKTNKLGQFTGSTPLPNGTYTLELEKENLNFDVLQMELSGQVLPPLIITAKN